VPIITLIDTPWPVDSEAPVGWAPIIQKPKDAGPPTR
jgi:hypothetical protein